MRSPLLLRLGFLVVATASLAPGADGPAGPLQRAKEAAFLDATAEITQTTVDRFRGAVEGDIDLDGDQDVVMAQAISAAGVDGTQAVGALLMNENGSFVNRATTLLPHLNVPQVRWWATVADFGSPDDPPGPDGWPDIVLPGGQGEATRFFLNRGRDGQNVFLGFEEAASRISNSPLSTVTHSYHSQAADFDGDGLLDLVVFQYKPNLGATLGQIRILMNSNGTLVDETSTRMPTRNEPSIFGHAADLNGDGHPDLVFTNLKNGLVPGNWSSAPSIRVLINDGTGRFPTSLEQVMLERSNPSSAFGAYAVEVGDFNADGRQDLYVINWGISGNEARDGVLLNRGSGNQLFNQVAYPELSSGNVDDDGDHPIAADLDNDGRDDVVVAQFSTRPFVLMNRSRAGVMRLVETTPPQVPGQDGFRVKIFDANTDGAPDVWFALRDRNYLLVGNAPEKKDNDSMATAEPVVSFPALRTGIADGTDRDFYALPAGVLGAGARLRLQPALNGDLRLRVIDAGGTTLLTSQLVGNGVVETIDLPAAQAGAQAVVERQGAQGGGMYRLEVLRPGAARPETANKVSGVRHLRRGGN